MVHFWPITHPPPIGACLLTWRQLYAEGWFFQRELVSSTKLRDALRKREVEGSWNPIPWRDWDAEGAVRPLGFSRTAYMSGTTMPAIPAEYLVFVDERPSDDSWDDYAWDAWGHPHISELYSPWQLLPLVVVFSERAWPIRVSLLLNPQQLAKSVENMKPLLEARADHWRGWHQLWEPTLKVLVRLQNRYWPPVHGRVKVLTDPETGEHFDPEDRGSFDPQAVLGELELTREHIAESYMFLARRGQRFEPGDQLHLLRQMTSRRRRRDFEGPARVAQDFYDAAEIFRRFYHDLTGTTLPDPEVVTTGHDDRTISEYQDRRTQWLGHGPGIHYDADDLKKALIAHDLYPGRIHLLVEGESEVRLATMLVEELLGSAYLDGLLIDNLRGVGAASRIEKLLELVAEYSLRTVLIVDSEGAMPKTVARLVAEGLVDRNDVLLFDHSMEESNFTDGELVRLAKQLAATGTDKRAPGKLKLTGKQLRAYHDDLLCRLDQKADPRGLADSLQVLARRPEHGTITIRKPDLAEFLCRHMLDEFKATASNNDARNKLFGKRPILKHLIGRVLIELSTMPLNRSGHGAS